MDYKKLQQTFERELLYQIITKLRGKKLAKDRAQKIAKDFLPVLKSESIEDFNEHLSKLSRIYPEIMEAFIVAMKEYEKESVNSRLQILRNKLKGGLSSEALVKGGEI